MTKEITNTQDIIDSRDIIARIEELQSNLESVHESDNEENGTETPFKEWLTMTAEGDGGNSDEAREYVALQSLADEASGCSDWQYGESLIRDSYFEDYARQLAEDIGAISGGEQWPCTCIDWARAAEELQQDYTSVDFDGEDYWIRA